MKISHKGLAEVVSTFETENFSNIEAGAPLTIDSNRVSKAQNDDAIIGFAADKSRNRKVAVQLAGYVETEVDGQIFYGIRHIKMGGEGKAVMSAEADSQTIPVKVIYVDNENSIAGFIM